jgi:hypothetical protein
LPAVRADPTLLAQPEEDRMSLSRLSGAALLFLVIGAGHDTAPASAADKAVLALRAIAVNMSGVGPAQAGTFDIVVERWSTDGERDRLRAILATDGSDALLSELRKVKPRAGYIRGPFDIGWNIKYAREHATPDGGRRIVLGTERPMSFWEAATRPRSADYAFTLAEIRLGKDGKGEGKIVSPAKISWNKETEAVEITNYGTEPVRLTRVEVEERTN